jgi:hypothetical protein
MLDGKAYKAHSLDDPAYSVASRVESPRIPNSAVLLAALAALEEEFSTILSKTTPRTDPFGVGQERGLPSRDARNGALKAGLSALGRVTVWSQYHRIAGI